MTLLEAVKSAFSWGRKPAEDRGFSIDSPSFRFSLPRVFAPPKYAVESLAVQAEMVEAVRTQSHFEILVRHFLNSFFNNEMVSSDGEAKSRLIQIGYAIALPQLIMALFLFAPYHQPHPRPYWSQVGDRYFYVVYSMVAVGAVTVFEWDLFFPNMVDVFVLSSLPVSNRKLFEARITAIAIFLLGLIVGLNSLGMAFFPASCDLWSPARHFAAHFLAIFASGVFTAVFVLGCQALLLAILGQRLFQRIAPVLQGLFVAALLTVLILSPAVSRFLKVALESHSVGARWFPPIWFLGIYERLLTGPSAGPLFGGAARMGVLATVCTVTLAALLYPLAYWRRTQQLLLGRPERDTRSWFDVPLNFILHRFVVRVPVRRAILHFISQTLVRTHRHRVYLAMYGGVGLALMIASALLLKIGEGGHIHVLFSADGLEAAIPIAAFWTIAGLRNAFVSPVDHRGSWIFRVIRGRPGLDLLLPARGWVLGCALAVTLTTVGLIDAIGPASMREGSAIAVQVILAMALCLLLRDAFFLGMKTIPFTGAQITSETNLAVVLIQYFGLFPPMVLIAVEIERWMQKSFVHSAAVVVATLFIHLWMRAAHRRIATEHAELLDVDAEEEEFPQRLGLRY
jgi:hypothetical protein